MTPRALLLAAFLAALPNAEAAVDSPPWFDFGGPAVDTVDLATSVSNRTGPQGGIVFATDRIGAMQVREVDGDTLRIDFTNLSRPSTNWSLLQDFTRQISEDYEIQAPDLVSSVQVRPWGDGQLVRVFARPGEWQRGHPEAVAARVAAAVDLPVATFERTTGTLRVPLFELPGMENHLTFVCDCTVIESHNPLFTNDLNRALFVFHGDMLVAMEITPWLNLSRSGTIDFNLAEQKALEQLRARGYDVRGITRPDAGFVTLSGERITYEYGVRLWKQDPEYLRVGQDAVSAELLFVWNVTETLPTPTRQVPFPSSGVEIAALVGIAGIAAVCRRTGKQRPTLGHRGGGAYACRGEPKPRSGRRVSGVRCSAEPI